eukprot:3161092-Amphidinium_carterae.1
MAEAKQLAEKVDKQTKVIEEAVEKRAAFKEELVTVILKIKALPPDTVPVPKPSPATYLASSSALEQLLECASRSGNPEARALAEKVDQERKATTSPEVAPGIPATPQEGLPTPVTPVQATGQRGSPLAPERGSVAALREDDVDPSTLPAVVEQEDEAMEDDNGETPSPEPLSGAVLGADAMAVEEARKRIHATLDAGED